MKRPTHKELTGKLKQAMSFLTDEQVLLLNPAALAVDALELGYAIEFELLTILKELLEKTTPKDYTGGRPPQRPYEQNISGLDLFAFTIETDRFSAPVYFKFTLAENVLWLVSLHKNR